MSTQFHTTDQQTPYQQTPYQGAGQKRRGPSWFRILCVVIGTAVAVAVVALAVTLSHSNSSQAPATNTTPTSTSAAGNPTTPAGPGHSVQPVTPVKPSAAVMQLQRELGQLNYYEGPVDGVMGPQTIAAIKDLQRQAGLPQTGEMNAATQAALANFLAHGNNQMGGNS
jgi:hypothetical protein